MTNATPPTLTEPERTPTDEPAPGKPPDRSSRKWLLRSLVAMVASVTLMLLRHHLPLVGRPLGQAVVVTVGLAATAYVLTWTYGSASTLIAAVGRHAGRHPGRSERIRLSVLAGSLVLLAILIVYVVISGYLALWMILLAAGLLVLTIMLSPEPVTVLLAGLALIISTVAVFVGSLFRGTNDLQALVLSAVAVVVPVVLSERILESSTRWFSRGRTRPAAPGGRRKDVGIRFTIVLVLTLTLSALGLSWSDWLPSVAHRCYTVPTSTAITALESAGDSDRCYGLLDTADPGAFARTTFGHDPVTSALQRAVLGGNRPVHDGDLTVVWMGALSCAPLKADESRCADGRDYPAERDQLRALLFAQDQIEAATGHRLHVVLGDAGQDVAHADDLARLIIERRAAMGARVAVVGGGDSRDITQRAINRLLDAGIPFIAPNLLADLGAPGRPFVDRPGYLQLAPANLAYAQDALARLTRHFPRGFSMNVYQHLDPTDQYTTSLVNDLLAAARTVPGASARHLSTLDSIDPAACSSVLFFADRWTRFGDFVQRLNDVCGYARPKMVVADGSVGRFMANYQLRAVSNADWPVDYYVGGPACAALRPDVYATFLGRIAAHRDLLAVGPDFACADRVATDPDGRLRGLCTLDAAVKLASQPCRANDLGTFLIPAYDAVLLADALLPPRPVTGRAALTSLNLTGLALSTGARAEVREGRLVAPTVRVDMWHVDPVNDPSLNWERPSPALATAPGSR